MIANMWDDASLKIKTELDGFKDIQKETLETLICKQKDRKLIATQVSKIFSFAKSESELLVELSKKSISSLALVQIEEKLRIVEQSEALLSKELFDRSLSIWEDILIIKLSSSILCQFEDNYIIRDNINTLHSFSINSFDGACISSKSVLDILYVNRVTGLPASSILVLTL